MDYKEEVLERLKAIEDILSERNLLKLDNRLGRIDETIGIIYGIVDHIRMKTSREDFEANIRFEKMKEREQDN